VSAIRDRCRSGRVPRRAAPGRKCSLPVSPVMANPPRWAGWFRVV